MALYPLLGPRGIGKRFNRTMHGRSRYRPADVPGHNVFNGFTRPGWGDGIDLFAPGGTPVYAPEDGIIVRHANDETRLEVVYLQGAEYLHVLGHVNLRATLGVGSRVARGQIMAYLRKELGDPHLHYEVARGQRGREEPLAGNTVAAFARKLQGLCGLG